MMNAFFSSQLAYYPVSWMFHSTGLNHKINRVHERGHDMTSSFEELLQIDNFVSI